MRAKKNVEELQPHLVGSNARNVAENFSSFYLAVHLPFLHGFVCTMTLEGIDGPGWFFNNGLPMIHLSSMSKAGSWKQKAEDAFKEEEKNQSLSECTSNSKFDFHATQRCRRTDHLIMWQCQRMSIIEESSSRHFENLTQLILIKGPTSSHVVVEKTNIQKSKHMQIQKIFKRPGSASGKFASVKKASLLECDLPCFQMLLAQEN